MQRGEGKERRGEDRIEEGKSREERIEVERIEVERREGERRGEKERPHLFQLEYVLVEVVLETLVGKVDAELFEAVVLVVLEAKDVQHSNGQDLIRTHSSDSHNSNNSNSNSNSNSIPKCNSQ